MSQIKYLLFEYRFWIMWCIILTLVYWALYKIVKEYSLNTFNSRAKNYKIKKIKNNNSPIRIFKRNMFRIGQQVSSNSSNMLHMNTVESYASMANRIGQAQIIRVPLDDLPNTAKCVHHFTDRIVVYNVKTGNWDFIPRHNLLCQITKVSTDKKLISLELVQISTSKNPVWLNNMRQYPKYHVVGNLNTIGVVYKINKIPMYIYEDSINSKKTWSESDWNEFESTKLFSQKLQQVMKQNKFHECILEDHHNDLTGNIEIKTALPEYKGTFSEISTDFILVPKIDPTDI